MLLYLFSYSKIKIFTFQKNMKNLIIFFVDLIWFIMLNVEMKNKKDSNLDTLKETFSNNEDDPNIREKINVIETVLSSVCNFFRLLLLNTIKPETIHLLWNLISNTQKDKTNSNNFGFECYLFIFK
jgi:hypothetical protein